MEIKSRYMKKIPQEKNSKQKVFHIYLKDECVFHSLGQEEFDRHWGMLCKLIEVLKSDVRREDLSYEAVTLPVLTEEIGSY